MSRNRTFKAFLIALSLSGGLALAACDEDDGPMEKAGQQIDEAVGDAKRAVEDAAD